MVPKPAVPLRRCAGQKRQASDDVKAELWRPRFKCTVIPVTLLPLTTGRQMVIGGSTNDWLIERADGDARHKPAMTLDNSALQTLI